MGLLSALLAACSGASAQWSRQKQTIHHLDGIASLSLPERMLQITERTDSTPDLSTFFFWRINDTHINGTTSYAEEMTVTITAPDLPPDRFDRLLKAGEFNGFFGRSPGLGEPAADGRRWLARETVYERHPVTEPSWQVRLDDPKRGVLITWRGFKKQYTLEQAKENLATLASAISIEPGVAAEFAKRRSWSPAELKTTSASNNAVAARVLAEFGLTLPSTDSMTRLSQWRLYLDDERPQQLHLVHELATLVLPDAPFRLNRPVTYFKYMQQRWMQETQGQESDRLPPVGQRLLAAEFGDQGKIHFYQMRAVDLWRTYPSETIFADQLRRELTAMLAAHATLLRDGFIAGDSEP